VAVLSHGLWQRRFGGAEEAVGRSIDLSGVPHKVVGVLPEEFRFPEETLELWVPFYVPPRLAQVRAAHFLEVAARLKKGVTLAEATAAMDVVGAQLEKDHPDTNRGHYPNVVPFRQALTRSAQESLLVLVGAVGLVLLIACANVANLLLARGLGRAREMAVRTAMGAGRGRLIRLLLAESLLLSSVSGVLGLIVAVWSVSLLAVAIPPNFIPPGFRDFEPDLRVLVFTMAVSLSTGLLFGIAPALQATQTDVNDTLKEGGRGHVLGARNRTRSALLVTQIALALVLLVGSGLLIRSFVRLQQVPPGFRQPETVLTAQVMVPQSRYHEDTRIVGFYEGLLARVGSLPGVEATGAISKLALTGQDNRSGIAVEGRLDDSEPTRAHDRVVAGDYFRAMGVPLVAGRLLGEGDRDGRPLVVVVNRTMARRYWPDQGPVGKRVRLMGEGQPWREVVGVVEDVRHWGLQSEVRPEMYLPLPQKPAPFLNLVVRSRAAPGELVPAMREQLRAVDPNVPLSAATTLEDVLDASVAPRRFYMALLAVFAAVALGLACVGLYSVVSFSVAQRTREIGVRMALGANATDVWRLVLGQGLRHTAAGIAVGLAGAVGLTRFLQAVLFGVSATDPITFGSVALILTAVAVGACWLPARRATRVEPMAALRHE